MHAIGPGCDGVLSGCCLLGMEGKDDVSVASSAILLYWLEGLNNVLKEPPVDRGVANSC